MTSLIRLLIFAAVVSAAGAGLAKPPNIVLISLDTVRADHMSCYGYDRPTTPRIDAMAGEATLFRRAMASSSWTVPTHASMFTGKFPFEHGAHAYLSDDSTTESVNPLPESAVTLAEVMRERGYRTGAFTANKGYFGKRWQLLQGFDAKMTWHAPGKTLNPRIFQWLNGVKNRPFFLFVNYMDSHRPYNTQPVPNETWGPPDRKTGQELLDQLMQAAMPDTGAVPEDLIQKVVDQYDTGLANADAAVGQLIAFMREHGIYDNTVIVITSDHGEFLGEHNLVEHSKDIYQEVLAVPLIVKGPGQREGRVEDVVATSSDIPNLVLSQFPAGKWSREQTLFPDAPGSHPVIAEIYYTRGKDLFNEVWGHRFMRVRTAYFDWPYKYIYSSDGDIELYHLEDDPAESTNLVDTNAVEAVRLDDLLHQFLASRKRSHERVKKQPMTEEEIKRLKALGYIGD
jgi:arylsulfatase A-like enzyme